MLGKGRIQLASFFCILAFLISCLKGKSFKQKESTQIEANLMKTSMMLLEILVGLLVLIIGIINLFPFKFFNVPTGATIMLYGIIIAGVTMLVVGAFGLSRVYSYETLSLAKKINVVTSVLTMAMAVVILFFQLFMTGSRWLHLCFGIGLLGFAVGQVAIGR